MEEGVHPPPMAAGCCADDLNKGREQRHAVDMSAQLYNAFELRAFDQVPGSGLHFLMYMFDAE